MWKANVSVDAGTIGGYLCGLETGQLSQMVPKYHRPQRSSAYLLYIKIKTQILLKWWGATGCAAQGLGNQAFTSQWLHPAHFLSYELSWVMDNDISGVL